MGHRAPLARRDHERVQPPRQHGRARGDACRRLLRVLRDRRGDRARERDRAGTRSGSRARVCRVPAVQPQASAGRRRLHGRLREPRHRLHPRLACSRRELDGRGNDRRDDPPPLARARDPDSRHDARDDRAARREAARDAGWARPHLTQARLLRPVGDEGRAAARDRRIGDRCDGARLQRARQRSPDGDRHTRDLRAARAVRELPQRPRGALAPRRRRAGAVALARDRLRAAATGRGVRRLRPHLRVVPGLLPPRRRRSWNGVRALGLPVGTADPPRGALRVLRRARRLSPGVAVRNRTGRRTGRGRLLRIGGGSGIDPRCAAPDRVVPGRADLRHRRPPLHRARRRLATRAATRARDAGPPRRAQARADRRRRARRARPRP